MKISTIILASLLLVIPCIADIIVVEDDGSGSKLNLQQQFVTAPDVTIGTPSYLSPEQIRCQPVDKRTDVYQLGAILYQGISGRPPFSSKQEAIKRRQDTDDHSFPKIQGVDKALEDVFLTAMQVEKEDRYQSVEELQMALKDCMDEQLNKDEYLQSQGTTLTRLFRRGAQKKKPKQVLILSDIVKKWVKG